LAGLLLGGPSRAADMPPPQLSAPSGNDPADDAFREGNALYRQQRWAEAKAAFDKAFRRKKAHDIAANLAYAEMELGLHRDAAEHLSFAVKNWAPTGRKDTRQSAIEWLEKVKKQVGTLSIVVSVPGALVEVDGQPVGRSPIEDEVFVDAGPRVIRASLAGFEAKEQRVDLAKGEKSTVTITMERPVAPPPPPAASASASPSVVPPPPAPKGANQAVLIGGGAAAGAALVLGVTFTVLANGKAGDADELRASLVAQGGPVACGSASSAACSTFTDAAEAKRTFSNAALWSFVGAGAIGAATVVYALVAPSKPATASRVRVLPMADRRTGGIVIGGAW
jgi:tetratricopeptide (TPR) repeat protein